MDAMDMENGNIKNASLHDVMTCRRRSRVSRVVFELRTAKSGFASQWDFAILSTTPIISLEPYQLVEPTIEYEHSFDENERDGDNSSSR
jgi:hypothetical protein